MPSWPFQDEKTRLPCHYSSLASNVLNSSATLAAYMLCVVRWAWRLLWRLAVLSCCTWHDLQLRVPRLCITRGKVACQTDLWAQKKNNTYRFDAIAVRFHVEPGQSWASVFMPIRHKFVFYAVYGRTKGNRH